jgi:hypothetical protein
MGPKRPPTPLEIFFKLINKSARVILYKPLEGCSVTVSKKSRLFSTFKNQSGLGLVEVMIASGILTVLMLGVANMMTSSAKTSSSIEKSLGWDQLISIVTQSLNSPTVCTQMLNKVVIQDKKPFTLCIGGQNTPCTTGIAIGGPNSIYGGILIGATPIPAPPGSPPNPVPMAWAVPSPGIPPGGGQVVAYFTINGDLKGPNPNADAIVGGGIRSTATIAPKGLMVTATVNAAGVIQSCSGGSSSNSLGAFQCRLFSASQYVNNNNVLASCNAIYPYALNGGCSSMGRIDVDYISTNIQYCHQNGGTNMLTSYINCCQ